MTKSLYTARTFEFGGSWYAQIAVNVFADAPAPVTAWGPRGSGATAEEAIADAVRASKASLQGLAESL